MECIPEQEEKQHGIKVTKERATNYRFGENRRFGETIIHTHLSQISLNEEYLRKY